jgi:hypothetical protein
MAGEAHMKGYMNGARTELELNRIKAAMSKSTSTSGINHHFFSSRRKRRNSLHRRHMWSGPYISRARMAKALAVSLVFRHHTNAGLGVYFDRRRGCRDGP